MKVSFFTDFFSRRPRTLTASLLCVTLLFSDLPAQAQTPALPLSPAQVLIPAEYGRVEESRQAGSKTIFFLQDAHDSLEAQENIAALIHHLVEKSGIKTVFEEGYEGPVPADDYFGPLKDPEVREKVSYYLLDQLRIGGAEYAHINRKRPFKLMGGDDARLHRENIGWYRKTAEHREEASQGLKVLQQEIVRLADRNFPVQLKEWMKLKTRFDQGKISFWDYLQRLREPGAAFFHEGLPAEAMTSRYPVLSRLYRAAMKDLSQELRDGDVNAEVLFRETSDFENAIADTLITLERDRQTFTFYKTLELLLRLNSLEVSYDEYQALRGTLPQAATEDFARFISLHANRSVSLSKRWEENVRNAMQFYETAGARDRAVEKKLIEFKADAAESSAVLVFGGFHRSAIREILRRQGFSYQIISPVISEPQEKHRERYRHLMAADYETRFVPASVSAASRALSDIAVAELSPVYKRRFAEELNVLSRAAMNVRGGSGGDLLLGMQQELKKQPEILRSELRAEGKFQRGERLTQEKLEEEVRKLGETSLEVGGNDRTGWAVSTEKRYDHDRLHALERTLSKRFKGYRFSFYHDVRTDQDFKRLDILPPLSSRSELRPELKNVDAEVLPHESKDPQAAASGLSGRSELRGVNGILLGAGVFENPLWLLAVPPALAAAVYFLYQSYHLWISKRIASALAQGARYIARGSYTHVLKHAGFPGYVILVKRHPFVMRLKQGEAIRSPQVTEAEEWKAYKALKKLGLAPFTRYAGKFPMKNMHPEWAGTDGEDVFRADQKKLAEMYGKVSSSMMGVSVYLQEEGVPLNQFVRENPDQKILADKSLAGFTLKLWNAGWIDLDIGRRNYLLVTDREGKPLKNPDGLLRLKAHDFGAIMPIPEDLEQFMLSKHTDSDVTRGFFLLRNLTATVRAAAVLFPRLDLKKFHEISKAADEAAERMKTRGDKAAFRQAYLGVIESPQNKKVITELSIDAARMIRKALEGAARSELRAEDAGEGKDRKRIKQRVRAEAEKRVLAARKVLRTRIIFIGFASAALLAGGAVYWMLPNVPAQPAAAAPSEAVIERQRFATIRGIHIADSTRNNSSQRPELIDAIAEGYDAADRVRKSQIASYQLIEGQAPVEEGQAPGVVFQVQPHTPLDVAPPFEPVQIRRDAAGRLSPVDLQGVRNSVSGGRVQTVEQVREWMAWLPLAAVGLMAVLAYAFLKGVRRVDTGSIMDVKNASDRSARDISKLRAAAEKKNKENEGGSGRSELRIIPDEKTVDRAADVLLKFIGQQSGEKLSEMGYRFTIVHDVEQVTMRNLLLNFWPEVTALIGTDNPEAWFEKLEGIKEGQMGRAVLERIRPMFLSMSRFGRHAAEGQEDFRLELGRVFEQRSAEENPEPVRILVAGPGYLQEAVEVLAAADASVEALAVSDQSKLRLEVIVADQPGELADHYQSNNLVYHSRDVSFLPEAVRDRYLEAVPGGYRIRPEAHERLSFRFLDLNRHRDYGQLGLNRGSVDFVLNHNLEPYLKPRAVRRLSEYLHAALRDEGVMYARLTSAHFDGSLFGLNGPVYWLGDLFEYGMGFGDKSQYPTQMSYKFHKKGHSPFKSPIARSAWRPAISEEAAARENALDPEDENWLDRVLGPARSELRSAGREDSSQKLKVSLLGLMTVEGTAARNKIFNDVAEQLKDASPSLKGRFKKLLLELLDNSLERQALREIGSFERETSAWQRALYRRLYEHLYDENGSLRKDIKKLETAPSAAVTLKYEDTFTVRAGRRKETLRVERLTSLSQSDWNQIFEIYAPYNLRDFHRDLMSGRRSLSGKENAVFVVRTSENKIAGFSWAFADPAKRMLGLAVSGVAKPYRGKGLAARLLISRLEWGMSNGLTYARTHVGDSGRNSGWHWRLLALGGRLDSLLLKSPLPEIGIRPEDQAAADRAMRAAQQQAYPGSRKALEAVLKKYTDADLVVNFDLRWRVIEKAKGRVLAESVRSELRARADESSGRQPLKEQMDQLLAMYPPEGSDDFYDLTDEKGFFRGLRELLRQYQKAESARNAGAVEARSLFEVFQKSLTALLARLEFLAGEDYSKLAEFNPGAANATFGVMAVQLKPEILHDETPRQFFFGPFSLKQLTESGALKVDVRDGVVVSPLPEVKGVLADLFPEVMREKLETIQTHTSVLLKELQGPRSELRAGGEVPFEKDGGPNAPFNMNDFFSELPILVYSLNELKDAGLEYWTHGNQAVVYRMTNWPYLVKVFTDLPGYAPLTSITTAAESYRIARKSLGGLVPDFSFIKLYEEYPSSIPVMPGMVRRWENGAVMELLDEKNILEQIQAAWHAGDRAKAELLMRGVHQTILRIFARGIVPRDPQLYNFGTKRGQFLLLDPGDLTESFSPEHLGIFLARLRGSNSNSLKDIDPALDELHQRLLDEAGLTAEKIQSTLGRLSRPGRIHSVGKISDGVAMSLGLRGISRMAYEPHSALDIYDQLRIYYPNLHGITRSELRTEETSLQDFVNRIISSHAWPDIIEVDIDPSLRIKQTSASLGFAIFELLKNAIDGNRVYEKKSGTDSRPDVRLTASRKDGWVELRIENRGVLAVDKLRSQAREGGVWKLRPWAPDKHLWPYPYIMESSMPEEPMPYQRMRPEEVDAMADEDLLFHVKGLTLRSDENLRRIGLLRADLTGGMGIGLKQVWRVMETVDPERPVHYEMGEIDGAPSVAFSVRLPEAAPRSELRNLEGPAPALETADFFLKRLGTLSEIPSAAYSRLELSHEGKMFFFETLKTTLAASFGESMRGFTEADVAPNAYVVKDDKSGVPLGVLYQFGTLPIFFDFIELTRPTTEAALLDRDHAGAWAAADQTARRVYRKELGQVHFLERLTLAGLSSDRSRWLTERERLQEKISSGQLSLFVISEIQDWSRKADIFLRPDQVGSLDFQQTLFRINRQRPEFFKSILGITGFGTGVDSLLAIRYGAEAIHGTEPYALVRLLGELNIRYARESGQISAELPVTVERTKGLSKNSAVRTWFFNTPLVVKNGTRSTFMPANVRLPIALLPSTGSLYLEESEFQSILKEAASMMLDQPDKRAVMRVDGDFFTTPEKDLTAYLDSVRAYLEKFGLSLTGYYGGAFVEFQASSFGRAGQEAYLKSAFKILEEDGQPSVPAEALLWFIRQLESAAVTAADGGTVSRDTLDAWKKKLLENPARSELRTPSEAEYEQIAAEAERLRELVEVHSLLRNKPDGTGKSDIVKALAEARDLSRERGDIERIAEIVKRANGWYPGRVNTNYFQFDDRNIKKQLAAFSRSVQKVLRDSNAGRSELRMYINDLVRQQFVIAGVPFLDEHIPTDKGVFRPTLSGLVDPLAEYAGHYKPIRIIDLGSGQGAMVFAFARANDRAEVLGIEFDEQLFNDSVKVRDSFFEDTRKRIRLERGDFNDPRFAEEIQKADLVNYWETGARAEGTMLLNLAKNMRAGARFLVTKNSGRFITAVKDTGYFDLAEEVLDDGIFLFTRNDKPFEDLAAEKPGDRSELRSEDGKYLPVRAVEKMTVPAAVFLDARELTELKAGQADERFDELLTFLERHPAFDLYIDRGDQYPLHNLELPKLRQILSEFPGRVHFGERSRANLAKKKILLQVSLFEDSGSSAETRKLIQDIQRRYRIQSDLLPVEYLLPGSLKGFLGLAESFTQAELIREIGEAYATRSAGGRWRLAADFAASLWARIQNDYAIQWSA